MTNDELVERVARKIDPDAFANVKGDTIGMILALDRARAAIATIYEALQEPDEGMIRAFYYRSHDKPDAESAWNTMLSASPLNGGK